LSKAHHRYVASLKNEHDVEYICFHSNLHRENAKVNRLHAEYDYISSMYQEQTRGSQEQDDRINYLENGLQDYSQSTWVTRTPLSASPSQVNFSTLPHRQRSEDVSRSPAPRASLSRINEAEEN
jgi:hypothetical protein